VIAKIQNKFPALINQELVPFEFLNDKVIYLPKWYAEIKGHDLETKLKTVFPSFQGKFRSEGKMQEELTKNYCKVISIYSIRDNQPN
jgi:hypothetical protein